VNAGDSQVQVVLQGESVPGLVSVIVPVFNGARWLRESIESIVRQTYRPIEVIAVDDGSTDDSVEILRDFPDVRTISQPNAGCATARNRGLSVARGEFLAFNDQDDRWVADKLERQVALLQERPDAGYALGLQRLFLEPGCELPASYAARRQLFDEPHTGFIPGTLLARRATLERIGVFDPRYEYGSDSDWFIRARGAGIEMAVVDAVVIDKRIHDSNLSSVPASTNDLLAMLARSSRLRRVDDELAPASASQEQP
jgi:glycosyltransferase involved in cell wall biosynthesis